MNDLMGISRAALLADLEEMTEPPLSDDGWLSMDEWAAHWSCAYKTARETVQRLRGAGRIECSRRQGVAIDGHMKWTPVYRLIEKGDV